MSQDRKLVIGGKWHLVSKNGVYEILHVLWNGDILLTTNKWRNEKERGDRKVTWERVKQDDLKCKYNGR